MKKIIRMAMVCALAGATLLYTGCTKDYSDELSDLDKRVVALETSTAIADLQSQINSLASTVNDLKTAQTQMQATLAQKADKSEVETLKNQITGLNTEIGKLQKDLAAAVAQFNNYYTKEQADAIFATQKSLADQKKELETLINDKETALNAAIQKLGEDLTKKIEDALKGYYTKEEIDNLLAGYYTKAEIETKLANYFTKAEVEGMIADVVAKFDNYYTKDQTYNRTEVDSKIADVVAKFDNYYTKDQTFTKEEVETLVADALKPYYTAEQVEAYVSNALKSYYTKAEADALFATKAELADAKSNLEGQIADAKKVLNERIDTEVLTLNNKISALDEKFSAELAQVKADIESLVGAINQMIQSVVFVPEYDHLCAVAYDYGFAKLPSFPFAPVCPQTDAKESLGYQVIEGTFQVYPAALASKVKAEYEAGNYNVFMQLVNLKPSTKVANDFILSEDLEIVSADDATGYLFVKARFNVTPENQVFFAANEAISLWISEYEAEEATGDELTAELGITTDTKVITNLCSHYAPVVINKVNLNDSYILANNEGEEIVEYPKAFNIYTLGKAVQRSWDLMGQDIATVAFYEDYDPMMLVDGETLTLAEAAAAFFLPVEAITPAVNVAYFYTDRGVAATEIEGEFEVAAADEKAVIAIKDTQNPADAIPWVRDIATAHSVWTVAGNPVIFANDSYEIIPRQIILNGEARVDWTYDFAVKHSDNPENPTKPNVKPVIIEDLVSSYTGDVPTDVEGLVDTQWSYSLVIVDGDTVSIVPPIVPTRPWYITFDEYSLNVENKTYTFTADVNITNYEFFKDKESSILSEVVYNQAETATELVVRQNITFGKMAQDLTFDYGTVDYYYKPTETINKVGDFALANAVEKDAAFADYFTSNEEFFQGFVNVKSVATGEKTAATAGKTSEYSYLCLAKDGAYAPKLGDGVNVVISQKDVATYQDVFAFQTVYNTWYGTSYTFKVNNPLIQPNFKLAYWENKVNFGDEYWATPYSILKGKYEKTLAELNGVQGKYMIDNDNLSRYYRIVYKDEESGDSYVSQEEAQHLTVKYEVLTKEDIMAGYKNVPAAPAGKFAVNPDNFAISTENAEIAWANYTARDLKTKASLYCNDVFVNELTLDILINDPITTYETMGDAMIVYRKSYENATAYIWNYLKICGILNPATDLINHSAVNAAEAFRFGNPYQLGITFGDDDLVGYIGTYNGEKYDVKGDNWKKREMVGTQLIYDNPGDGVIIYNDDSAYMQEDVIVDATITLNQHVFNYLNAPAETKIHPEHSNALHFYIVFRQTPDDPTPTPGQ